MTEQLLFEVLPFAAAVIFAGLAWHHYGNDKTNAQTAAATAAWPIVPGQVQSSGVVERITTQPNGYTGESKLISYEAKVAYAYNVGGKPFVGNRLNFRRDDYGTESAAKSALAKFPAGATVDVAYDPSDPATSVLDRDAALPKISSKTWQMLGISIISAVAGVYVAYAANAG